MKNNSLCQYISSDMEISPFLHALSLIPQEPELLHILYHQVDLLELRGISRNDRDALNEVNDTKLPGSGGS